MVVTIHLVIDILVQHMAYTLYAGALRVSPSSDAAAVASLYDARVN